LHLNYREYIFDPSRSKGSPLPFDVKEIKLVSTPANELFYFK
jgi:hypothetical protein